VGHEANATGMKVNFLSKDDSAKEMIRQKLAHVHGSADSFQRWRPGKG